MVCLSIGMSEPLIGLSAVLLVNVVAGYRVYVKKYTWLAWLLLVATAVGVERLCQNESPLFRMLAIIVPLFVSMKIVTAAAGHSRTEKPVTFMQWVAFAICWAGMRVQIFHTLGQKPLPEARAMLLFGLGRLWAGAAVLALAHGVAALPLSPQVSFGIVSALLLVGISLLLHFGLLAISAGCWQFLGVRTYFLFNAPLRSATLTEFWSKRWNVAFSEMTAVAVYRPLKKRLGSKVGMVGAFLFSGLLHEMAISLPVWKGFGWPLAYFALHGLVIVFEEALAVRKILFLRTGITGRMWVYFWVLAPLPMLFHTPFLKEVVWPLAGLKPL